MGYLEDNANKIASAFERFRSASELTMLTGMKAVLDAGVEYCLQEHDNIHRRHADEGDGYGWILLHNGNELERKLWGTDSDLRNNASDALTYVKSRASSEGYVGIILATVKPVTYFNALYEFIPMRAGIRDLKSDDFSKYFKTFAV